MRRLLPALVLALALVPAATAAAAPPSSPDMAKPNVSDTRLASEFLRVLQSKDIVALRRFLSPAFLLQRPDGTFLRREPYIANPAVVESFTLSDVVGTRFGDVRVIRYTVVTSSVINGVPVTKDPVARLSTFVYDHGAWRLIAHANFTAVAPAAAAPMR